MRKQFITLFLSLVASIITFIGLAKLPITVQIPLLAISFLWVKLFQLYKEGKFK